MNSIFQDLINEAYSIFPAQNPLSTLDACLACCMTEIQSIRLMTETRENLTFKDIYEYNSTAKSGYTIETLHELKHFLPVMISLFLHEEEIHHSTELFFQRVKMVPEGSWNEVEIDFFERFATNYWMYCLTNKELPFNEDIGGIYLCLYNFPIDKNSLLQKWEDNFSPKNLSHLIYILNNGGYKFKMNAFFNDDNSTELISWLKNDTLKDNVKRSLERIFWEENHEFTDKEVLHLESLYILIDTV
ncbi:hypothetical protein [uncultured Kordia sp.]|uniref:hypothetical protein n=1 Tax=uncultured Kordia sp. TaxID=507699 RepID=UPI002625239B|nr:hypothetical protein [uncultured Kordia sp.]